MSYYLPVSTLSINHIIIKGAHAEWHTDESGPHYKVSWNGQSAADHGKGSQSATITMWDAFFSQKLKPIVGHFDERGRFREGPLPE